MPAAKYDFTSSGCQGSALDVGATFSNQIIWQKEDPAASLLAGDCVFVSVDMTGYSVKMQVRQKIGSPVILELSTLNGRVTLVPLLGTMNLVVAAIDTITLPPGIYRYDLDLTDLNGFVTKFIEGSFEIRGSITVNG